MEVDQAEDEFVSGDIVPWLVFKMKMGRDRATHLKLSIVFAFNFVVTAMCVVLAVGLLRILSLPGIAYVVPAVGDHYSDLVVAALFTAALGFISGIFMIGAWWGRSRMSIVDPGPYPFTPSLRQMVERQKPYGDAGFADPAEAVRDLGSTGDSDWALDTFAPKLLS